MAVHIGSQIIDLAPSRAAFRRVAELVVALRDEGFAVRQVDLGGGLTIPYGDEVPATPAAYVATVREVFGALDLALAFEPGRFLVGDGGILVASVIYVKEGGRRIVVVDAAMNDLVRPAMYKAEHRIVPIREAVAGSSLFSPMSSGRCARRPTRSPAIARCRRWTKVTSLPSPRPVPMARS